MIKLIAEEKKELYRKNRSKIVSSKNCECGCCSLIPLRKWHFEKNSKIPKYICGHNPETQFKKNNKISFKTGECYQNGYICSYAPDHPNKNANNQVRRARLVMEKHIGRYLEKHEHVHHINKITTDDRIENLMLLNASEHMSIHHKNKKQRRDKYGKFI